MREGHVPAFLTTSPRSFLVGSMVLFSLPFLTLWFGASRLMSSTLALWAGVVVSTTGIWVATPQLREDSNLWPIDFALLAFSTGISLWVGALAVLVVEKTKRLLLRTVAS
jgi:hypothetical protein